MKKTIFLIILGVVTVGCIIYGTVYHIGGGFKNLKRSGFIVTDDGKDGGFSLHFDFDTDEETNDEHNLNQKLQAFSKIKIDSAIMEIRIEEGNDFYISSNWNRDWLRPEVSVNNGVLNVIQKSNRKNKAGTNNCRVTITVPADTKLGDIDIDSNVGEIKLRKLEAEDVSINLNVGEISLRDMNFENVTIDNNVGEVSVDTDASLDDYDISLATDVGQVNYIGRSYKRSYNQNGSGKNRIKINTNVGEINVN